MSLREFSAKTSWTLYEEQGSQICGATLTSFYHCQQNTAQNKAQLPDLEMRRKQRQKEEEEKVLIQSLQKQYAVLMQGRNKETKQWKYEEIQSQIQQFEKNLCWK